MNIDPDTGCTPEEENDWQALWEEEIKAMRRMDLEEFFEEVRKARGE